MAVYTDFVVLKNDGLDTSTGKYDLNAGIGVPISVFLTGTTTLATIRDLDGNQILNPMSTDSLGNYQFDVDDGVYDVVANFGAGIENGEVRKDKQPIYDLNESRSIKHYTLADSIQLSSAINGQIVVITDTVNSDNDKKSQKWQYVLASSVTPNGINIIQCTGTISNLALKRLNRRRATMSIIFDDGYISATGSVRSMLDSFGVKAGFALSPARLGNQLQYGKISEFLDMEQDGHEILSHGYSGNSLGNAGLDESLVESEINGSYWLLSKWGFNIRGYVGSQTFVNAEYIPILQQNFGFSFTTASVDQVSTDAFQDDVLNDYALHRTSGFNIGVQSCKDLIDLAVAEGDSIVFTEHDPDQVTFPQSLTIAEWTDILTYAQSVGIDIITPSEMMNILSDNFFNNTKSSISKFRLTHSENVISDSEFGAVQESAGDLEQAWLVDDTMTNPATITYDDRAGYRVMIVDIPAGNTTGRILISNETEVFDSNVQKLGLMTFQANVSASNADSVDDIDVSFGTRFIYESNGSVFASDEYSTLHVDETDRVYKVQADANNNSAPFFIRNFISVTPKTGVAETLYLTKPMLCEGFGYKTHNRSLLQPNKENLTPINETTIGNASYTKLNLEDKTVAQVRIDSGGNSF